MPADKKEIKHFIRASATAKDKSVITETVEVGSASFKFLGRMEERRKQQECMLILDMRGKVPYECKSHIYRNRVFWMDDISFSMFLRGLEKNNLVFTTEVFEQIINGKHTIKGARLEKEQNAPDAAKAKQTVQAQAKAIAKDPFLKYIPDSRNPDHIPLGYYLERKEERYQHFSEVQVVIEGNPFPAKTRDISPHGLMLVSRMSMPLPDDGKINLTFSAFNEEQDAGLVNIEYKVVNISSTESEYRIQLKQTDQADNATARFIGKFIKENLRDARGRRKLDHEDVRLTSYSLLAEKYYTLSTPVIPFFLSKDNDGMKLSVICKNTNNAVLLDVFKVDNGSYDFRGLADRQRIKGLYSLTQEDGQKDPLIAVYRLDDNIPRVIGEFEFPLEMSWVSFIMSANKTKNFRVFKILSRPVVHPDKMKVSQKIERLVSKSKKHADEVVEEVQKIQAAGVFVDVTEQVLKLRKALLTIDKEAVEAGIHITEKVMGVSGSYPDVLCIGYMEKRKEDRYQVNVAAQITVGLKKYAAVTQDISVHGICVELDSKLKGMSRGGTVSVALPGLHERAKQNIKLTNMPYEITCIEYGDKNKVHLKRLVDKKHKVYTGFFQDLISRNIDKLTLEMSDHVSAATSRLYGSVAAESTATIPFFVTKDPGTLERQSLIALPMKPGTFVEFFEIAPGEYDFTHINVSSRLSKVTSDLREMDFDECLLYLYKKQVPGQARFQIYSAAEFEFESYVEKSIFINEAKKYDYCIVKILAGGIHQPADAEINTDIDRLMERSSFLANKLKTELSKIIAVGEIINVTRQIMDVQEVIDIEKEK